MLEDLQEFKKAHPHLELNKGYAENGEHDLNPKNFNTTQVDAGCYPEECFSLGCIIRHLKNKVIWQQVRRNWNTWNLT